MVNFVPTSLARDTRSLVKLLLGVSVRMFLEQIGI